MSIKSITFNKIFEVIKEEEIFFISERKDKKNFYSVFDLPNNRWCLVKKSKDEKWLMLFYKELEGVEEKFYISFARQNKLDEAMFTHFKEIEKGSFNEKWMKEV